MNILNFNIIYKFLLLFSINIIISSFSFATDWEYIGYGKTGSNDLFYVFVDNQNTNKDGKMHQIKQKHIFNNVQKSKNNDEYIAVEIERTINCKGKTITNNKALFIDIEGQAKRSYMQQKSTPKAVSKDGSINYKIFKNYCK